MSNMLKSTGEQSLSMDDCGWDPEHLDWETARRLWAIHRECAPDCRPQLAAGAVLSDSPEED